LYFRISGGSGSDVTLSPMHEKVTDEFSFITLDQLEIVATLGMGGFGRVELVSEFLSLLKCLLWQVWLFCSI
jgi:hypothetical protein